MLLINNVVLTDLWEKEEKGCVGKNRNGVGQRCHNRRAHHHQKWYDNPTVAPVVKSIGKVCFSRNSKVTGLNLLNAM